MKSFIKSFIHITSIILVMVFSFIYLWNTRNDKKNKKITTNTPNVSEFIKPENAFNFPVDFKKYKNITLSGEPYIKECLNRYNERVKKKEVSDAVYGLTNYITLEPLVAVNETCKPPPLPDVLCENYKTAFGNNPKPDNKKVGILIQFGFDVDILEIYLNEVYDLVDKFFITESVVIHSPQQDKKPLIWEKVKHQKRFSKFQDKIVHFIIDGSDLKKENGKWVSEHNQEILRWKKFLNWNEENKFFNDNDLIGFGDADEIPSRKAINILKHCSGDYVSLDIGSLFVYGTYDTIVKPDWSIVTSRDKPSEFPYSFGDPSFYTLKSAKAYSQYNIPSRRRGRSGKYILGNVGIHLTYYPYLPFLLNKSVVCSECKPFKVDTSKSIEEMLAQTVKPSKKLHNWKNLDDIRDEIEDVYFIPWFLKCNPGRFPVFFNNPDPRLYLPKEKVNFEC